MHSTSPSPATYSTDGISRHCHRPYGVPMNLSLPYWLCPEGVADLLTDDWFTDDETVLPWNAPTVGGHGTPINGWDPDRLDSTAW